MSPLAAFRRELHAHPELPHCEHGTAQRVVDFLTPLAPDDLLTGLGGTGVLATFGTGLDGPTLLFRSELDALPIAEIGVDGHGSRHEGVSHKCGHDGHMAMLCGLALWLSQNRPDRGAVHLLFQPAEETGTGAAAVLADPRFDAIQPDFGVAIHNMPGFPMHSLVVKPGWITAAVRSLVLRFQGRTAHASEPEKGENPTLAIADLVRGCEEMNVNDISSPDFCLVTPVHVRIGSVAYGVSAGDGEVHLTIRTTENSGLTALQQRITDLAEWLAARDGLLLRSEVVEDFYANVNDAAVTDLVVRAARECDAKVLTPQTGLRGGEDFGLFSERFPTCMVMLGAGEDSHPIHNPFYDFPDELIDTGVNLYTTIVRHTFGD